MRRDHKAKQPDAATGERGYMKVKGPSLQKGIENLQVRVTVRMRVRVRVSPDPNPHPHPNPNPHPNPHPHPHPNPNQCTRSLLGEAAARPPWTMARGAFVFGCVLACALTIRSIRRRRPTPRLWGLGSPRPAAYPWRAVHV